MIEKEFVYKSTLRSVYGLTPAMIKELGEPDKRCDNLHWITGPYLASLYSVKRVEAWVDENRKRLEKAKEDRAKRAQAAKAAHARKRLVRHRAAERWVESVEIEVLSLPPTLIEDARRVYSNCTEKALGAYVRHRLTNYDSLLQQIRRHEFETELYPMLRRRIDKAVSDALGEWRTRFGKQSEKHPNTTEINRRECGSIDNNALDGIGNPNALHC